MASHWVGTWTATPAPAEGVALSSPTIRMFPRISIGGDTIRIRLSNAAGTGDLVIASTHVARRAPGPAIVLETDRVVTFNGSNAVKIPAGTFVISDPVSLTVASLDDLAVSIHIPSDLPASFGVTGRYSRQLNYLSPPGDFTGHEVMHADHMVMLVFPLRHGDLHAPRSSAAAVPHSNSTRLCNISISQFCHGD